MKVGPSTSNEDLANALEAMLPVLDQMDEGGIDCSELIAEAATRIRELGDDN